MPQDAKLYSGLLDQEYLVNLICPDVYVCSTLAVDGHERSHAAVWLRFSGLALAAALPIRFAFATSVPSSDNFSTAKNASYVRSFAPCYQEAVLGAS